MNLKKAFTTLVIGTALIIGGCGESKEQRHLRKTVAEGNYQQWLMQGGSGASVYQMKTLKCFGRDTDRNQLVSCSVFLKVPEGERPKQLFHECSYEDNDADCRKAAEKITETERE